MHCPLHHDHKAIHAGLWLLSLSRHADVAYLLKLSQLFDMLEQHLESPSISLLVSACVVRRQCPIGRIHLRQFWCTGAQRFANIRLLATHLAVYVVHSQVLHIICAALDEILGSLCQIMSVV